MYCTRSCLILCTNVLSNSCGDWISCWKFTDSNRKNQHINPCLPSNYRRSIRERSDCVCFNNGRYSIRYHLHYINFRKGEHERGGERERERERERGGGLDFSLNHNNNYYDIHLLSTSFLFYPAPFDYTSISFGVLTYTFGQTVDDTQCITVNLLDDNNVLEQQETFAVSLMSLESFIMFPPDQDSIEITIQEDPLDS